jgi:hypothetical protein
LEEKRRSGGGERPGTRERLGFKAFGGEKIRASTRCSFSCAEEEDSYRKGLAGRGKRTGWAG